MKSLVRAFTLITAIILLAAAFSPAIGSQGELKDPIKNHNLPGWWSVKFAINWPEDIEPLWHVDLLLAHQVIWPTLQEFENQIPLWRFHRRAARDPYGHLFSFIFYSTPEIAEKVYKSVQTGTRFKELQKSGLLKSEEFDDPKGVLKHSIEDTSDKTWSDPVKKSWPYFIMGASRTWLALIIEVSKSSSKNTDSMSLQELTAFYKSINEIISGTWQEEGPHALLHHLNGIFGYKPLSIYEKRSINF